jgi:hypothetical protein
MKATCLRAASVVVGLAAVFAWASAAARADEALLKEALEAYEAGNYEEGLTKLREYVQSDPGNEEVYAVLRTWDEQNLLRVLAQQGEHERLMTYLWNKARPAARERQVDPEEIGGIVDEALSSELDRRINAGMRLKLVGELAVPHLLPHLASQDAEKVVYAMFALHRIGPDATHALAAALRSDDARLRGFVAATLGDVADPRAVPALLRARATDADPGVVEKATAALRKIGGDRALALEAPNAYTRLGQRYYANDPTTVSGYEETRNLWRFEDGQLVRYEVPAWLYPSQMAEQLALDALELAPQHRPAKSLLVRALLAQRVEAAAVAAAGGDVPEVLGGAFDLAASQGFQAASDALDASLNKADWDVALEAIRLVARTYGSENLVRHPLGRALEAPERRVRYEAAIAALHMSPKAGIQNADKVAELAAQAASEEALRQVLVIDDRDDTRSRLLMDLAHGGFVAAGESSGADGVNRAKASPMLDVVVVRSDLGDHAVTPSHRRHVSSLMVIDELLADARTKGMRILVLLQDTPEQARDVIREFFQTKYGESLAGFVEVPIDTTNAVEVVTTAAEAGELGPERERANQMAARAAGAFAETDFTCRAFNLKVAVEPLAEAAVNGPTPEVKLNAVKALGNIRSGGLNALLSALKEGENEEIQVAAAQALGSVLAVLDGDAAHVDALIEAAKGEGAVASAALEALGKVRALSPEQRLQIFREHRLAVPERAGS